jgi:hypothetical protein
MRIRHIASGGLLLVLGALLGEACVGTEDIPGGQCEVFGGTCAPSVNQCAGSLPYQCNVGVCCDTVLPPVADATSPTADASLGSGVDATRKQTADATLGADGAGSDAGSTPDATTTPDTGSTDATSPVADAGTHTPDAGTHTPDTGTHTPDSGTHTPDSGTQTPDAGTHTPDAASVADAGHDAASAHDAGGKDAGWNFEAGFTCNHYASPNEPASACNIGLCPSDPFCQPNSCFNGDFCHLTTGNCIKPSAVLCDGGV